MRITSALTALAAARSRGRTRMGDRRPFDPALGLQPRSTRTRLFVGGALAVIVLGVVATVLTFEQYREGRHQELADARTRVVLAAASIDVYFTGAITALQVLAAAPALVDRDEERIGEYLRRVTVPFNGGIAWIDRTGVVRVSRQANVVSASVADRLYFKSVLATGKPWVSEGVISRATGAPVIVIAVPTFSASGRNHGVLAASLLLDSAGDSRAWLQVDSSGAEFVDRAGNLLLEGLSRAENLDLLTRMRALGTGVVADTPGLDGSPGHAVAFATARVPGWTLAIDRERSDLFAAPVRTLVLSLAALGIAGAAVLALLGWAFLRSRREAEVEQQRIRVWAGLTERLGGAASPDAVAEALAGGLAAAFPAATVAVLLDQPALPGNLRLAALREPAGGVCPLGHDALVEAAGAATSGSGLVVSAAGVVAARLDGGRGAGGAVIVAGSDARQPSRPELALLAASVAQAAQALDRARLQQREHDAALTLQHGLLPDALPSVDGVQLAGRYRAGGDGVEIGGDWYDAVRRADGRVCISVGDVVGHGIPAAVLMARLRHSFRAYALDGNSPAEILARLSRHLRPEDMATALCVEIDPYARTLAYAAAGHPPALLATDGTDAGDGTALPVRLDGSRTPPLGFADPAAFLDTHVALPERGCLILYTDGLIERRGADLGDRIEELAAVLAVLGGSGAVTIAEQVHHRLTAGHIPDDDVALVVAELTGVPAGLDLELPAAAQQLAALRRRLRPWLAGHGLGEAAVADVIAATGEAVNNAIEHGFAGRPGMVRLGARFANGRLRLTVADDGAWREPQRRPDRGRGIMLMRGLMDEVDIETSPTGTVVTMHVSVSA